MGKGQGKIRKRSWDILKWKLGGKYLKFVLRDFGI